MNDLDRIAVNTIRALAIDMVEEAASGHPGLPLGAAPAAWALWKRRLRHDPSDPSWPDRDRFVLSAGHGSALLYALLHLAGYDLGLEDLRAFRQWGSRTPGHPEFGHTPGVEATTGPLGQGSAVSVGMAMAERLLASRFNKPGAEIVNHRTWALVSDGDLMEGIAAEAASLAGHLRLGRLVWIYDSNDVTLDGPASIAFGDDTAKRFEAYGWRVLRVENGDEDLAAIEAALDEAASSEDRPALIEVKTTIGFGSPNRAGKSAAHGSPLGAEEAALTKKALGLDPSLPFHVPEEARAAFAGAAERGAALHEEWKARFASWAEAHGDLAAEWSDAWSGELPEGWDGDLPEWKAGESVATRKAAGEALRAIAARVPRLAGGDADLSGSTNTFLKGEDSFTPEGAGRNVRFGVREHAMGAIANGMAYHGGIRPYAATFLVFSDYMRPAVRLAAMNGLPVVYVWTHDSIALGEDGPTHQPVEHLAALRAIPNLCVFRPADAAEAAEGWRAAMLRKDGPTALILSRQGLPVIDRTVHAPAAGATRGAYVLADAEDGDPRLILIATGSEVSAALGAREILADEGIAARVVSMPSWEIFAEQDEAYRNEVLPPRTPARLSVEAGVALGWERWTGPRGASIGVERFGSSAPGGENLKHYGLTAEAVAARARELLGGGSPERG